MAEYNLEPNQVANLMRYLGGGAEPIFGVEYSDGVLTVEGEVEASVEAAMKAQSEWISVDAFDAEDALAARAALQTKIFDALFSVTDAQPNTWHDVVEFDVEEDTIGMLRSSDGGLEVPSTGIYHGNVYISSGANDAPLTMTLVMENKVKGMSGSYGVDPINGFALMSAKKTIHVRFRVSGDDPVSFEGALQIVKYP